MAAPSSPARRPRVLHIVDSLDVGGLEILTTSLIEHLAEPYEHVVYAVRSAGPIAERLRERGTRVEVLGRRQDSDRTVVPRLVGRIRELAPEVVHVHSDGVADAIVAGKIARAATVFTEHGWVEASLPTRRAWLRRGFMKFADRVIAVSEHFRRELQQHTWVPEEKIRLIRNAVPALPQPVPAERAEARARLGLVEPTRLIGSVGMLRPVKNFTGLVEAFAAAKQRHPEIQLAIVGEGPERSEIEGTARRLGVEDSVLLPGLRLQVREYLAAFDVFVLASDIEGTSLALLEASWCGLPIVATDVGGNSEVVQSGCTGQLIPARDSQSLAGAIGSYLDHPSTAQRHGNRARERVESHYSFDYFLGAHSAVYRELAEGQSLR